MQKSWIALATVALPLFVNPVGAAPIASEAGKIALWCSAAYVMAAQTDTVKSDKATQAKIMEQSGALSRLARTALEKDGFSDDQIKAMIDKTSTEVVDQFSSNMPPAYSKDQCEQALTAANVQQLAAKIAALRHEGPFHPEAAGSHDRMALYWLLASQILLKGNQPTA